MLVPSHGERMQSSRASKVLAQSTVVHAHRVSLLQADFYPLLEEWLASPAGTESRNNIIRAANGTIVTSQLGAFHSAPNDQVKACSSPAL